MQYLRGTFSVATGSEKISQRQWDYSFLSKHEFLDNEGDGCPEYPDAAIAAYPHVSTRPCRKCNGTNVRYYVSDGDYADEHYHCLDCQAHWWIDGPDS